MEPFSLLKFWRNAGTDAASDNTNVDNRSPETDEETDEDDDINDNDEDSDSDSFFDLVFTAPDCYNKQVKNAKCVPSNNSSPKGDDHEDSINNLIELESPLKSKFFPVDSNSKPQSPISLLKSAPKFRVFLLGFRKPKSEKSESSEASKAAPKQQFRKSSQNEQSKRFTVKCEVEQVPIGSLFSRDNSLRSKLQRERSYDFSTEDNDSSKPLPKDVPMYLKLIKPLYIRASRRYTDKIRLPWDQISTVSPLSSPSTVPSCSPRKLSDERRVNRGVGFKVVSKRLGKSRSAASTGDMTSSPANRRDDSLLLHNDGIQSAILHCKRSYNSTAKECSALLRSSQGKSMNPAGNLSSEQRNRCSSI